MHYRFSAMFLLLLGSSAFADTELDSIEFCKDLSILAREVMVARQNDRPMSEVLPTAIKRMQKVYEDALSRELGVDLDDALSALEALGTDEMEIKEKKEELEDAAREAAKLLLVAAYDVPSYSTPGNQKDAINDFENEFFEGCYIDD